ncbi:MAG: FecR domain-containing protein [Bacteroidota bacterium]
MYERDQMLEKLLLNDKFITWVNYPTPALDQYWLEWQNESSEREEILSEARQLVQQMNSSGQAKPLSDQEVQTMWQNLQNQDNPSRPNIKMYSRKYWIAASIIFFISFGIFLYLRQTEKVLITHQTTYGETQSIVLPDSSLVILNANSSLVYTKNWKGSSERKVILEGEAFFDIRHTYDHRQFFVKANSVTIEVLGTSFNVHNRRDRTQVVLQEGKVSLYTDKDTSLRSEITMQPGELVEITDTDYIQREVDVNTYTAWTQDELIFSGTSIADIARMLEDNYGLEIHIQDNSLANKRFTGRVASGDLDGLFGQMKKVFQIDIQQNRQQVIIGSNSR